MYSFLGVYSFGLFTTTIFANAGQVVTGNQTPHFLSACKPNYTALGCHSNLQYITERRACTGNPLIVASARKSFPSKDAALSVYSAVYTVVSIVCVIHYWCYQHGTDVIKCKINRNYEVLPRHQKDILTICLDLVMFFTHNLLGGQWAHTLKHMFKSVCLLS